MKEKNDVYVLIFMFVYFSFLPTAMDRTDDESYLIAFNVLSHV